MRKQKQIGVKVKLPEKKCNDRNCPFHGNLKLHGRMFTAIVKSAKAHKTAVVYWEELVKIKKYERYEKRRTKILVHVPDCVSVNEGDRVRIMESRPISKNKSFVIIEVLK